MKSGEMKHEMTSFHTMGSNRNVLFQIYLLFVTIYCPLWSFLTQDDAGQLECATTPEKLVMTLCLQEQITATMRTCQCLHTTHIHTQFSVSERTWSHEIHAL